MDGNRWFQRQQPELLQLDYSTLAPDVDRLARTKPCTRRPNRSRQHDPAKRCVKKHAAPSNHLDPDARQIRASVMAGSRQTGGRVANVVRRKVLGATCRSIERD